MKGEPFSYVDMATQFVVYPEYCELSLGCLIGRSVKVGGYHVATLMVGNQNEAVVYHDGEDVYSRSKYRLTGSEIRDGVRQGVLKPEVFNLGWVNTLILVCYEIVFPEDYLSIKERVDLVIHMIGMPMFSEEQREGWVALQKVLSLTYKCPVVCCCGGKPGRMNITGVINEGG